MGALYHALSSTIRVVEPRSSPVGLSGKRVCRGLVFIPGSDPIRPAKGAAVHFLKPLSFLKRYTRHTRWKGQHSLGDDRLPAPFFLSLSKYSSGEE